MLEVGVFGDNRQAMFASIFPDYLVIDSFKTEVSDMLHVREVLGEFPL